MSSCVGWIWSLSSISSLAHLERKCEEGSVSARNAAMDCCRSCNNITWRKKRREAFIVPIVNRLNSQVPCPFSLGLLPNQMPKWLCCAERTVLKLVRSAQQSDNDNNIRGTMLLFCYFVWMSLLGLYRYLVMTIENLIALFRVNSCIDVRGTVPLTCTKPFSTQLVRNLSKNWCLCSYQLSLYCVPIYELPSR